MTSDDLAAQIVARCRERLERGETVDTEAVLRAHPDLAPTLREQFVALRALENAFARGADADAPSLAGQRLGRYRLDSRLGSGGMGTVYLASVEEASPGLPPGTRVAIKVIHPHHVARQGAFQRFLREAELGRRVRHENVVRTLDADEHVDGPARTRFLVLEYVEGRTLRALLDELGRVPEELCRHVGREISRALAAIHAAGVVHRDVKPDNVLITKDHVVKVMDLGAARVEDEAMRISQTGAFVGSVRYAAPEQFKGRDAKVDGRADLYALGLTLYELATGRHPFDDDDFATVLRRQMDEKPRRAGEVNPQLSPFFEELLARLLAKDRAARPESADAVAEILERGEESTWWADRALAIRRETRRPLRRVRIARETALYGRDAELATLRGLFERANAGDGQVVLVEGEAGIGKSRLVDEFVASLSQAGEDVNFLYGSYPPGGAATASGAFTSAYREHLGDDDSAIREALPQTPLLVSAFAALLRGDAAPESAEKLTKDSLQTVFVHATRSFAVERPTIVLIDDLHFAPEEGRALFASLALAVPGHRVLLVGGARPSLDEKWAAGVARLPHVTRLPLPRLGAKDLVRLLHDALKSQHLAEELAGKIATKSDGNPFFVFEILRGLREGQFLTRKPDGTWITTREIREIQVPSSIVDVVQARVSDLDRADRDVLEVAACIGFEFDAALVGGVLDVAPIPLLQRLGAIEKRHRLVRSVGHRFSFDHHQVQEVLYAGLSAPLREAYHGGIAEAIEARHGAASKEPKVVDGAVCVDLAEHFLYGAQGSRALRYLDAALTYLEKGYRNEQAVALSDHMLRVPGLLAGKERFEILQRAGKRLDLLGRRVSQRTTLEEALALADAAKDARLRAHARNALGRFLTRVSQYSEAELVLRTARDLAIAAADRKTQGAATGSLGIVFQHLGRYDEARTEFERWLTIAQETQDREEEARATGNLGNVLSDLGLYSESRVQLERSLEFALETGDLDGQASATINIGNVFWGGGDFSAAQAQYQHGLALARMCGNRMWEVTATSNLGTVFAMLGCSAEAEAQHERSVALAREIGSRTLEVVSLEWVGLLRLSFGDFSTARRRLEEALAQCRGLGARSESSVLHSLAMLAREEGDRAGAIRHAEESLALRRRRGQSVDIAQSLIDIASLRQEAGDTDGARDALREALTLTRAHQLKPQIALALALLATLPGGDTRAAEEALAEAGDTLSWGGAARVRLLLWQATRDRAHLAEAKRLHDFLVEHAPLECRASMVANVSYHREIAAAANQFGL